MSSLFNTNNPAIAEAQQRVMDCLFTRPKVVTDIEQQKFRMAVRDQHKDMRRAAAELAAHIVWRGDPLPLTCAWCGRREVYLSKTLRLSFAGESWIGEYWLCGWCGRQDVETLRDWR